MYFLVLLSALLACAAGVSLNSAKPMRDGRIVGGTETDITSHPYQVTVLTTLGCSGAIISDSWVVTLAYCVRTTDVNSISVRSGSNFSTSGGTIHSATSVIIHEHLNPSNWDYDVALVQVSPAFTFSASVQPITLECDPVPAGTNVVLTGWGIASAAGQPLQQVTLQITSDSVCNSIYYNNWGGITERMICAGDTNGGKGACGDLGSPLVASNKLVGIFNKGLGCGDPSYPDVFTKISALCDWLVINAGLYKVSAVIKWIKPIPGLQTMPLTFIATYPNN